MLPSADMLVMKQASTNSLKVTWAAAGEQVMLKTRKMGQRMDCLLVFHRYLAVIQ
jgi:hypothetical protein